MWTNYSLCVSTQEKRLKVAPQEPPGEQQMVPPSASFTQLCLTCLSQKLKLLEDEYKCLLKMNRDAPANKSGADDLLEPRMKLLAWDVLTPRWCHRLVLQPQLGRLVVLGRHASGDRRLSELP